MAKGKGRSFALYWGSGASPDVFTKIGGLRATSLTLNQSTVDITDVDSSGWRELLSDAGIRSMALSGSGIFEDEAADETMRAKFFAGTIDTYQIQSAGGDKFTGSYQCTSYERNGEVDGAEEFSLTLESSGSITFLAA